MRAKIKKANSSFGAMGSLIIVFELQTFSLVELIELEYSLMAKKIDPKLVTDELKRREILISKQA
jgi:hypothetical protein